jgi:hypothetical protein
MSMHISQSLQCLKNDIADLYLREWLFEVFHHLINILIHELKHKV